MKKLKATQKRIQRLEVKNSSQKDTPRSKADMILKSSGIKPREVPEVRKRLIYNECINKEIIKATESNSRRFSAVQKVVSGTIMKKYRLQSTLQKYTTLNRRKTYNQKKRLTSKKTKYATWRKHMTEEVRKFLEREDNSRILPGKADAVKEGQEKMQKRVLNDFMYNLHHKFQAESTETLLTNIPSYEAKVYQSSKFCLS